MNERAFLPSAGMLIAFAMIFLACALLASAAISAPSTIIKIIGNKATINATYKENVVLSYAKLIRAPDIEIPLQSVYPIPPYFSCNDGRKSYMFTQTFIQDGNYTFVIGVNDCVYNYREDSKPFTVIFGPPPGCGDGFLNASSGEECDDNNTRDGDGCSSRCQKESCGNNRIDGGEVCDGGNLNGQTCKSRGYQSGTLACSKDCKKFETSNCSGLRCGNGVIDLGEECDGKNWGRISDCPSFDSSFSSGILTCDSVTCRFLTDQCKGFTGGTCGDKKVGVGEECDGIVRKKCSDFDTFFGDNLKCTANCTYDTSACKKSTPSCNDGEVDQAAGEDCDGSEFAGGLDSCEDFTSFTTGTLSCTKNCSIDTSLCGVSNTLNASCLNMKKDGTEVDVDCGGVCACCEALKKCTANTDCCQGYCKAGACAAPSCTDGVQNGFESGVDCGGQCEVKCAEGAVCNLNSDCVTGYCGGGFCAAASCTDGMQNGLETDIDCGGPCDVKCAMGQACEFASDCQSNFCEYGVCSVDKSLDTDNDGMPDWWEDKYGLLKEDPADALKDADKDGFSNLDEYKNGTDPTVFDEGGKSHVWNIIVLVIGLLLMIGSGGFLYYYREYYLPSQKVASPRPGQPQVMGLPGGALGRPQQRPASLLPSSASPAKPADSKAAMLRRFLERRQAGGQAAKPQQGAGVAGAAKPSSQPAASKPALQSAGAKQSSPGVAGGASDIFSRLKSISSGKPTDQGKQVSEGLKELASQVKKSPEKGDEKAVAPKKKK